MTNENSGGEEGIYSDEKTAAIAQQMQDYLRQTLPPKAQVREELGLTELDIAQSAAFIWLETLRNNYKKIFANIGPENVEEIFLLTGSWLEMMDNFGLYDFKGDEDEEGLEN